MGSYDDPEVIDEGEIPEPQEMGLDAITRSEIDMQIATAKKYPRNLAKVKKNIETMATLDEETAAGCFYTLNRSGKGGGKNLVQGVSIRLAEIALSCFGNVRAATRGLGETEDGRFVRELGICHDVENNVMVAREVKRRITTKEGKRFGDDMVGVTMAAAGAIALRNAILTVVPRALVKPAYDKAKDVAVGKTQSLTSRRSEILGRLVKLHPAITQDRALFAVGRASIEDLTWDDLENLIGLGRSIKDGQQTVEEAFPDPLAASNGAVSAADIMGKPTSKPEPVSSSAPATEPVVPGEGVKLSPDGVKEIEALLQQKGVARAALEELFGERVENLTGPSEAELLATLKAEILALQAGTVAEPAASSLFDEADGGKKKR